ncbi:MAG: CooT family nickel-binding protein [Deltaproteobacteria bacterium]|nr:CooT family nickel-binding protein [Deltaproteobacteria bacterium]MBW1919073.1 CooT family nickel-binding protein [Deltaproteobacteria bacterium]MBW1935397.1 CooT family nickel-binding protein [Deltaproteobacteria bacterium]MBW1976673.1 CooT family nickel-binding protein [Deltaproteobacteria bacterium]MBW2043411.1 CooT family nickel-binding protein [Deltaproteobacteria bacterium]
MCESTAYLLREGKQEKIFESVDVLESREDNVKMVNIFGEEMEVKARVKSLSLVDHKIILEPL